MEVLDLLNFESYGFVKLLKGYSPEGNDVIHFIPNGDTRSIREQNLRQMLKVVDDSIPNKHFKSRGIMIQSDKRFPTPCIIIFK